MPRSAAALASASRPRTGRQDRLAALQTFVADHLVSPDLDDLYTHMMSERLPEDTLGRVARAVATCGTARPYVAVSTLAAITAQHWRTIRAHLINHGIINPMNLPSLHALLDVTEHMAVEAIQEKTPAETKRKRDKFYDQLYGPEFDAPVNDAVYKPAGISDTEMEAAFDQLSDAVPTRG